MYLKEDDEKITINQGKKPLNSPKMRGRKQN